MLSFPENDGIFKHQRKILDLWLQSHQISIFKTKLLETSCLTLSRLWQKHNSQFPQTVAEDIIPLNIRIGLMDAAGIPVFKLVASRSTLRSQKPRKTLEATFLQAVDHQSTSYCANK